MRSVDDGKLEGAHKLDGRGRGRQEKDALPTFTNSYITLRYTVIS
jgi:hypothetical protein